MKKVLLILISLFNPVAAQDEPEVDFLEPLRFLIGSWDGEVTSDNGTGTGERTFSLILNENFIHIQNTIVIKNPDQTVQEDWGILSSDYERETYVLRQFSSEAFVCTYVVDSVSDDARLLVFRSEQIENAPENSRSRITIMIHSDTSFTEIYEFTNEGQHSADRIESRWTLRR